MIYVAVTIWCVGFALLIYGSTVYPLPSEYESFDEYKQAERRSRFKRYAGGLLIALAFFIGWLS
jgi:hypothetical protein